MWYIAIGKSAYYLSLDKEDALHKARKVGAGNTVNACLSILQVMDVLDLVLNTHTSKTYCLLPLVLNKPTMFITSSQYLYFDPVSHRCWTFDEVTNTVRVNHDTKGYCCYPNNTCYDSFDENMTLILDDYRKLMFYDFETGILYERTAEGIWYKRVKCSSIPYEVAHKPILLSHRKDGDFYEKYKDIHSTGRTVEKLSKKPKLSRPTYITERHFIKTTTE